MGISAIAWWIYDRFASTYTHPQPIRGHNFTQLLQRSRYKNEELLVATELIGDEVNQTTVCAPSRTPEPVYPQYNNLLSFPTPRKQKAAKKPLTKIFLGLHNASMPKIDSGLVE